MVEHRIETVQVEGGGPRAAVGEYVLDGGARRVSWKATVAAGVAPAFGCAVYLRRGRGDEPAKVVCVVGCEDDVEAVRAMYAHLVREIDRLADHAWRSRHSLARAVESARSWKNAFRSGAAGTIARRLRCARDEALDHVRAQSGADASVQRALVRIDQDAGDVAAHMASLRLHASRPAMVSSASGLHHGVIAGDWVDLDRARRGGGPSRLSSGPARA